MYIRLDILEPMLIDVQRTNRMNETISMLSRLRKFTLKVLTSHGWSNQKRTVWKEGMYLNRSQGSVVYLQIGYITWDPVQILHLIVVSNCKFFFCCCCFPRGTLNVPYHVTEYTLNQYLTWVFSIHDCQFFYSYREGTSTNCQIIFYLYCKKS